MAENPFSPRRIFEFPQGGLRAAASLVVRIAAQHEPQGRALRRR
jgi:hypothetical protein